MMHALAALCGALALTGAPAERPQVRGDYLEARTADIYTGPCFSNAEVFLTGHQAVLAWRIDEGSFDGVDLAGLTVAAAIRGDTTFSMDKPEAARSVLIVDAAATPRQREALVGLAKALAGARLTNVADVKIATLSLMVEHKEPASGHEAAATHHGMPQTPVAAFWAAGLAEIRTRTLGDKDHFCGNESVAYEPLSRGVEARPAYTLAHRFRGAGLDTTWNDPNCRSSFVGRFAF